MKRRGAGGYGCALGCCYVRGRRGGVCEEEGGGGGGAKCICIMVMELGRGKANTSSRYILDSLSRQLWSEEPSERF